MLLGLTRSPIPWTRGTVRRGMAGSWHLLAVADDPFTTISDTTDGVRLAQSPFTALGQPDRGIGVFAEVKTPGNTVTLRRSLSSGSSLYYTSTADGGLICATRVTALRCAGV